MTRKPDRWTAWERKIPGIEQMDRDDFRACAIPAERVAELLRREHRDVMRLVKGLRIIATNSEERYYNYALRDVLTALAKRAR